MPALVNDALIACLAIALLLAVIDHFRSRSWQRSLIYVVLLGAIAFGLLLTFPSRQAFGGASPLLALALMFIGVVFGIAATYVFNLTGTFSWHDLARPIVISP